MNNWDKLEGLSLENTLCETLENVEQIEALREFQSTQFSYVGERLSSQKSQTGIAIARQECSIIKGSRRRGVLCNAHQASAFACSRLDWQFNMVYIHAW